MLTLPAKFMRGRRATMTGALLAPSSFSDAHTVFKLHLVSEKLLCTAPNIRCREQTSDTEVKK